MFHNYQTLPVVADHMAAMVPMDVKTILEPTPGEGNLVKALERRCAEYEITAPERFEHIPKGSRFDWVVMNPPFTPMKDGYRFLSECMQMGDNIVALLPCGSSS